MSSLQALIYKAPPTLSKTNPIVGGCCVCVRVG
jgi:hypothetical protein